MFYKNRQLKISSSFDLENVGGMMSMVYRSLKLKRTVLKLFLRMYSFLTKRCLKKIQNSTCSISSLTNVGYLKVKLETDEVNETLS